MHRRHALAHFVAGCPLVGLLAAFPSPAVANPMAGQTFDWVGSSINHNADNHSWTDARNWSPEGVPGDGDAVNIVSPKTTPCDIHVDTVPQGVDLANLLLSTSTTRGCQASLRGGSITVLSTMEWTGGTLDTPVVTSPGSGLLIGDEPVHVIERLRQPLTVVGAGVTLASAHIRIQKGGSIRLDRHAATTVTHSTDVTDLRTRRFRPGIVNHGSMTLFADLSLDTVEMRQTGPVELDRGTRLVASDSRLDLVEGSQVSGSNGEPGGLIDAVHSTVSVAPSKEGDPALIDDVAVKAADSDFDVASGVELEVRGNRRGALSGSTLSGGGTLSIGAPFDSQSEFSLMGGSLLRLQRGGSLDGSCVYTGDGSFEWRGGELSGNDIGFALNDMTVGGATTKTIDDDHGFTSFVQVVNPVTFTRGTRASPNLLDMNGNSFQSFDAETLQRNVEIRDGTFVSSVGAVVINPGFRGVVRTDADTQFFSSGPLMVASGELDSEGELNVNGGPVEVRAGATLRLPEADHPLMLNAGTLTGEGTIDGDIVNSGGVFDPTKAGASAPMTLEGSYVQTSGGRVILDLSADSVPIAFGGSVSVGGIVTYQNAVGYRPAFGDERTPLSAGGTLTWAPSCEETTGTLAGQGNWQGEADQQSLLATFEKGAGGSCDG